ncbi:MAG: 50S ribosomal protein L1 [Alphaproteobacteria bacterium 33-17]|nr:MAG: 50S ribosomal protein L1 [Alphaproteobacteria bacterium 33-17]
MVDSARFYSLSDAISLIQDLPKAKFDESVDIVANLGVDTRHSDQNVRGVVSLPHGTGKTLKVAVFARGAKAEEAKAAGADVVGSDELIDKVAAGEVNFDRCIATPDMMAAIGKVAKVLGPRGMMPNPKLGTVTMDVAQAVKNVKAGQVEFRAEKAGIVHAGVAKASFDTNKIADNVKVFVGALVKARPSGAKGTYLKSLFITTTMGPAIKLEISSVLE